MSGAISWPRLLLWGGAVGVLVTGSVRVEATSESKRQHPAVPGFERFFNDPAVDRSAGGLVLLGELNCTACHRATDKALAHLSPKQAPILDNVGGRVRPEYLRAFLQSPRAVKPGTTMPDPFAGWPKAEKDQAVEALVHLLASTGALAETRVKRKLIPEGKLLYRRVGCVACHGPREGDEAPLSTSVPLPDLAAKYSIPSLITFLLDPRKVRPSGRMPGLNLNLNEATALAHYLLGNLDLGFSPNLAYRYYEGTWERLPEFDKLSPAAEGKSEGFDVGVAQRPDDMALRFEGELLLDAAGEYTFYVMSDDGSRLWIDDALVVDNDGVHAPGTKEGRATLAKGPHRLVAAVFNAGGGVELDIEMSRFGRGRRPVVAALSALKSEHPGAAGNEPKPPERFRVDHDLARKGRDVFARAGCASCHELRLDGKRIESQVSAPELAALRSGGCLSDQTARGRPDYGLSSPQSVALATALESLSERSQHTPAPAETIARSLLAFNCYACHQRDRQGGVEPARDAYFETTQKEMGDEGRLPPTLSGVGAKLNADYLKQVLTDGAKDRAYMLTRMPKFGRAAATLADSFAAADTIETVAAPEFHESPRRVKSQGRFLAGSQALGCIKCHTFKGIQAEGVQAIDMTIMTRRLRHDWFHRYLRNPQAYRPGTRMPAAWPDGQSLLPKVLGGNTARQIEAVWQFLADGPRAAEPYGLGRDPIPLVPEREPIIYRNFIQGAGPRAIAVGYPERANLAYDANDMRLALIWQGAFIDASRHWHGRGEGFQPPLGDNVVALPEGPPLAVLASPTEPWPTKSARALGYHFRGYRLRDGQRPAFAFDLDMLHVEDFPNPAARTDPPALERTLTITAPGSVEHVWFRAAVGSTIERKGNGRYAIDGEWTVRLEAKGQPLVRSSQGKQELLVPVELEHGKAEIRERFEW